MFKPNQPATIKNTASWMDGQRVKVVGIAQKLPLGDGRFYIYFIIQFDNPTTVIDGWNSTSLPQACLEPIKRKRKPEITANA